MNIESLAIEFWEKGYLCIDNFFNDKLMDQYQALILEHFGDNPEFCHNQEFLEKSNTDVIPWFPQLEGISAFDSVEKDKRLAALTEAILGAGWSTLYSMVMFSQKDSKGQAWHQDCPPEDSSKFNLNRLVYSMDIDDSVGGETLVMPGTHRGGAISVGAINEDFPEQVVLSPKKGTLLLLHGHSWHRVLPVRGNYRVSTNYRCCPAGTAENVTDICVYRNMRYDFPTSTVIEERVK
ncbi:MAG: phytanoyl-CoA dioxygenase family protein [Porticoccaceae bacterium]|nr:phytanoyl-CoA dioxygenase family protein [Porticoccaceae bacterium]